MTLFEALMAKGKAYHEQDHIVVVRHYWSNPYARGDFYRVYYNVRTERPTSVDIFLTFAEVEQVISATDEWSIMERWGL
jgi:hypothetical protein